MKKNTIFQKFGRLLGLSKKTGDPFNSQAFGDFNSESVSFDTDKERVSAFTALPWVSIAVGALMKDGGGQPWFYTDQENKVIETNRVPSPIKDPFINGFEGVSFQETTKSIVAQRALTGNSLLLKARKSAFGELTGTIEQLIPIRPGRFCPRISRDGYKLLGYEITLETGAKVNVAPEDVIHIRQDAIINPFWGIGNIEKMRTTAEAEAEGDEFTANFLRNRATPSMFIKEDFMRTPEDHDRIKMLLKKEFQGNHNTGKILYMAGQNVDAKQFQISQKDMQFIQGKEFNRDMVLSLFGVVPEAVGITDNSNRATSGESLNHYFKGINFILEEIEATINQQFVSLIDPRIKFVFKKHITADIDQITKMLNTAAITPNRAAELIGEPSDEGDQARNAFYLPSTLFPIGASPTQGQETQEGRASVKPPSVKTDDKQVDFMEPRNFDAIADQFEKSARRPKQFQGRYIRKSLKTRHDIEGKFTPVFTDLFLAQKRRVSRKLIEVFGKSFQDLEPEQITSLIFDIDFENDELRKSARRIHTSGVQRSIQDINDLTGSNLNPTIANPIVKNTIDRIGQRITGGVLFDGTKISVNQTTKNEILALVIEAKVENWSINELQAQLEDKFDGFSGWRARRIARTESRLAWDAGAEMSYRDLGVKFVDVVGCIGLSTQVGGDEENSDCGVQGVKLAEISVLNFHPNHIGTLAPALEI